MDMAGAEETILICEDSMEGIFTAIYEAYRRHLPHERTRIQAGEDGNLRLFASYETVETDAACAAKVARTLQRDFDEETYANICFAITALDGEKAQAVYRTVVWGLMRKRAGVRLRVMEHLQDPYIRKVMELSRRAGNETHYLKEFLRFQELKQGILFAKVGPKNNVLSLLTPHFADRLPMENFIIYDETHNQAAVHPAGDEWYLVADFGNTLEQAGIQYADEEEQYQELFRHFCHKISIKERKNKDLQRNMLPIHFRKYMTEFMPK